MKNSLGFMIHKACIIVVEHWKCTYHNKRSCMMIPQSNNDKPQMTSDSKAFSSRFFAILIHRVCKYEQQELFTNDISASDSESSLQLKKRQGS